MLTQIRVANATSAEPTKAVVVVEDSITEEGTVDDLALLEMRQGSHVTDMTKWDIKQVIVLIDFSS